MAVWEYDGTAVGCVWCRGDGQSRVSGGRVRGCRDLPRGDNDVGREEGCRQLFNAAKEWQGWEGGRSGCILSRDAGSWQRLEGEKGL